MARIFISHASTNNDKAAHLCKWLVDNGWAREDIFLDFDPQGGILPGERWQQALKTAADRCEVVLCLISQDWEASKWCINEYLLAKQLGKRCIPVLLEPNAAQFMLPLMQAEHQAVDLATDSLGYERLRLGLLAAGIEANSFPHDPHKPPYPGLRALTEEDPALFFGRDAQIIAALDVLRLMRDTGQQRMLVLLGASGCGKSSLLRAGLWPRLKRDSRHFLPLPVLRPARAVLCGETGLHQSLERALTEAAATGKLADWCPRTRGAIGEYLRQTGSLGLTALVAAIRQAHQPLPLTPDTAPAPAPTVVLFIDQLEELWSPDAGGEAPQFLELLGGALRAYPNLMVITCLRSPAYSLLQLEARLPAAYQHPFALSPMLAGSFRLIIERPAALARLKLEPSLVERLLHDATGPDALPLLAFTLERLYREYGSDGDLTLAEYEKLGGMAGAVEDAARNAFEEAKRQRLATSVEVLSRLLHQVFIPHLVRVDSQGEFTRRVAPLTDMLAEAQELVRLLANEGQRLLLIDQLPGPEQPETVEVSHEAVLREWRLLNGWLLEEKEQLLWRQRIEQAWTDYQQAEPQEQKSLLLNGRLLKAAQDNAQWVAALPQEWGVFVRRSLQVARRRRLLRWAMLILVPLVTLRGLVFMRTAIGGFDKMMTRADVSHKQLVQARDSTNTSLTLLRAIGRNLTWQEWRRSGLGNPYYKLFPNLPVDSSVILALTDRVNTGELQAPADVPIATLTDWAIEVDDPTLCNSLAKALLRNGERQLSSRLVRCSLKHRPKPKAVRSPSQ